MKWNKYIGGFRMNIKKCFTITSCFLLIFILTSTVGVAASETKSLVSVETVEYGGTTYVVEQTKTKNGVRTTKVEDGEDLLIVIFNEKTSQLQVFANGELVSDQIIGSDQTVGSDTVIGEEMEAMSSWYLLTQKKKTMFIGSLSVAMLAAALSTMVPQPYAACLAAASVLVGVTAWMSYIDSKYVDSNTIAEIAMHIKYHTAFYRNSDYTGLVYQSERYEWIYY
jgi:hypothetical protein